MSTCSSIILIVLGVLSFTACYDCAQPNTNLYNEAKIWTAITQNSPLIFKNTQQKMDTIQLEIIHDTFHCAGDECPGECEFYQLDFINKDQVKFFSIRSFSQYVQAYLYSYNDFGNRFDEKYTGYIDVLRDTIFSWKYSKLLLLDTLSEKLLIIEVENPKLEQINISKLYFQKHKGLIAYQDLSNEIWTLH